MRDEDDYDDRPQRRENIMSQRLRKSRGEEIDEDLDSYGRYEDDRPRGFSGSYGPPPRSIGGGGCAPAMLYLVIGGIVALLIVLFFFNQTLNGVGNFFGGLPDVGQILETPTPVIQSGAAVVQRIQELSRLETTSYTIERVIDVRQDSNIPWIGNFLAGDEILLIAHGTVVAGIDLGTLEEDAVTISPDGTTITLRLPPAQIFSASLDSSKTRVYSRDRGLFAPDNKDLETLARQTAEQELFQAACEDGIISKATESAQQSMRQFLSLLEYETIIVEPNTSAPCAPPSSGVSVTPGPVTP